MGVWDGGIPRGRGAIQGPLQQVGNLRLGLDSLLLRLFSLFRCLVMVWQELRASALLDLRLTMNELEGPRDIVCVLYLSFFLAEQPVGHLQSLNRHLRPDIRHQAPSTGLTQALMRWYKETIYTYIYYMCVSVTIFTFAGSPETKP